MQHQLLRERRAWDKRLGYGCTVCHDWWTREPRSDCPGVPVYSWESAARAGLHTRTQWKQQRRRVRADAIPQGRVVTQWDWYSLYSEAQTDPMPPRRALTETQRAALAQGRQKAIAARTCQGCGIVMRYALELSNGICRDCILLEQAAEERADDCAAVSAWARELLANPQTWVVCDTETTDLEAPEIVEIAVVTLVAPDGSDGGDGTVLLEARVRPQTPIAEGAHAVHGIAEADLADAPVWADIYPQLQQLTQGKRMLAYNADFDATAVATTCRLHQQPPLCRKWLDVMGPYAAWVGDWSDYHEDYRWQPLPGSSHRAVDDCRAVLAVLREMAEHPNGPDGADTLETYS